VRSLGGVDLRRIVRFLVLRSFARFVDVCILTRVLFSVLRGGTA
jgi:hypothetical protein